ncbi:MAG TPA: hypothetical protein VF395_22945, partial [Polyangiaceae bacterium]
MITSFRRLCFTSCAGAVLAFAASAPAAKPGKRRTPPPAARESPPVEPVHLEEEASPGKTIPVTVVEVAGTQAYLQPGANGGVRRGAKVILGRKEYVVVQATDSFAAIALGEDPPREGDKGQATAQGEQSTKARTLEIPKPLSTWRHAW